MNDLNIGDFIATLRKEKNLTQKELAEKLNVTDKAISKWERNLGYPDITIVSSLAKILGVNEGELLNGKKEKIKEDEHVNINNTVEVSKKPWSFKKISKDLIFSIISILFLIAIFVCLLCNYAISKTIDWSLHPTFSVIFTWLILITAIYSKKHKIVKTLLVFSIFVLPFIFSIEYCTKIQGWATNLGIPITIISLTYIWLFTLLFAYTKINKWYLTSLIVFCSIFVSYGINYYIDEYLSYSRSQFETFLNLSITIITSLVILFLGFIFKSKENKSKS